MNVDPEALNIVMGLIGARREEDLSQWTQEDREAHRARIKRDLEEVVGQLEKIRREWLCSGDDCSPFDHGRDEGLQIAVDAIRAKINEAPFYPQRLV